MARSEGTYLNSRIRNVMKDAISPKMSPIVVSALSLI